VRVSGIIACPRASAIEAAEPYYLDPLKNNSMETGQAWHAHMEKHSTDPENTEVALEGFIAGIRVNGIADRLFPGDLVIADWKTHGEFQLKYVKAEGAKLIHQAQVSIYAELCAQTLGWRPITGRILHHFSLSGKEGIIVSEFDIWPIDKVLAYRPNDGGFTVLELLRQANWDRNLTEGTAWRALPLAGETMMFGQKTMCDFCQARSVCWTESKSAPF
jgi:hypothetical protein